MTESSSFVAVRDRPARWRKALPVWVQALVLGAVFVSGIGVGAIGASRLLLLRMQHYRAHPDRLPGDVTASLRKRLGLTEAQSRQVLHVVNHRHARIQAIRQRFAPGIQLEFDAMEAEIAALLDSRQKAAWRETARWVRQTFLPQTVPPTAGPDAE